MKTWPLPELTVKVLENGPYPKLNWFTVFHGNDPLGASLEDLVQIKGKTYPVTKIEELRPGYSKITFSWEPKR